MRHWFYTIFTTSPSHILMLHSFHFLIFIFPFLICSGVLVLLVLRHKIIHIALCFCEFHLIHSFTGIPMQKSFPSEHGSKLLTHSPKHFLDGGRISNEGGSHRKPPGWNVTNAWFHIVRDPFHKVGRVLVLNINHLLIHFLGAHLAPKHGRGSEVPSMPWVSSTHHVLGIPHLLGQLWDSQGTVLLGSTGCQGCKPNHEEVKTREGDQVNS